MKLFIAILASTAPLLGSVGAQSCGPSGAHIQSGTPGCQCNPDGSTSCSGFQICGVGKTNAIGSLSSDFSATVQCQNKGGNIVDVKTQTITASDNTGSLQVRHGCLTVPQLETTVPSDQKFLNAATCPNKNWMKILEDGSISSSFTYSVTFHGFSCPFVTFSGDCSP